MRVRSGLTPLRSVAAAGVVAVLATAGSAPASAQSPLANLVVKEQPIGDLLCAGGRWAVFGREAVAAPAGTDAVAPGGGVPVLDSENEFVNDPFLEVSPFAAFPISFFDVVQSETEIAVLNDRISNPAFKRMLAGYNDSRGFTTNTGGISGFSYTLDSGETRIDGGACPYAGQIRVLRHPARWPTT
jgi:hypothetical protein